MRTWKHVPALNLSSVMETEEKKAKETKRLSPVQWEEIKTLWELGEVTLSELSDRYGISNSALSQGLKHRGATRGSRAKELAKVVEKKAAEAVAEIPFSATKQQRIEQTKRQHYEWSEFIGKATMGRLALAQRESRPFSSEMHNLKALRVAAVTVGDVLKQRYHILDVENQVEEGALPILEIVGMDDDRIKAIRETQDLGDDDLLPTLDPDLEEIIEDDGTS